MMEVFLAVNFTRTVTKTEESFVPVPDGIMI